MVSKFRAAAYKVVNTPLHALGYELKRRTDRMGLPYDLDPAFHPIYEQARAYTLTTYERMYALYQAVRTVVQHDVAGDIVECGVWKGGSSMVAALTLRSLGVTDRTLWLYDTYAGMSEPTAKDREASSDESVYKRWRKAQRHSVNLWDFVPIEDVRRNVEQTAYPPSQLRFVKGKVEDTIPSTVPEQIAILRLDTDWYESTRHELNHLFPLLVPGGVLIIDDYGHYTGAREAVDEYFRKHNVPILLNRIDYTGRLGIKLS